MVLDYTYGDILAWLIGPPIAVFVLGIIAPWVLSWMIRGFRPPPARGADWTL
jgi:hypothetical protein